MSRSRDLASSGVTSSALALKAPLASPAFTGTPTGITAQHVGLGRAISYRLTTDFSDAQDPLGGGGQWEISDDTEIEAKLPDTENVVTQSSGIFSFAETGHYLIIFSGYVQQYTAGVDRIEISLKASNNGSSGTFSTIGVGGGGSLDPDGIANPNIVVLVDVTSTSNDFVKLVTATTAGESTWKASGTSNYNSILFVKLANT